MMNDRRPDGQAQPGRAGLCERCTHVQRVTSAKGSVFYLCRLSFSDRRFARYPPLPVLVCPGHEPADPAGADTSNCG